MSDARIAIVLGTRPEIIKLSPVIHRCEQRELPYTLIHTGQHYSESLDTIFFDRLGLPEPDHRLSVGSGSHGEQTGKMIVEVEDILVREDIDIVLVQGDTNSVLAGAIATSKLDPDLGHIEAGLRSFDREMPEEVNRIVTDHIGEYLFAPTKKSAQLLREEGISENRIYVSGNTIVDAVIAHRERAAKKSTALDEYDLTAGNFVLMTAHRAENVDDRDRLTDILVGCDRVGQELESPVVYPIHPRTRDRIDEFDITIPDSIRLVEPLDFLDFLRLEDTASLVITDSGGVQEEACILQTPCVTVRDSTERPETVSVDANMIVGTKPSDILAGARKQLGRPAGWTVPFGDGDAAERILDVLLSH